MQSGNKMENKENNLIYHYCSLEAFLQIIKNNTLRFSDITKSNDGEEVIYISNLFVKYLKSKNLKSNSYNYFSKDFLKENRYFVLSLSTNCDSSSEWLIYGKNGISIGFDRNELKQYFASLKILGSNPSLDFIRYVSFDDLKDLKDKFDDYISKNDSLNAAIQTSHVAPIYKNKCWEYENEWRAYFHSSIHTDYQFQTQPCLQTPEGMSIQKEYVRDCKIIHFYDVHFPLHLIKEIWIGPKTQISKIEIVELLAKYDLEHKINDCNYPDIEKSGMLLEDK